MQDIYTGYWWFGVNNKSEEDKNCNGHIIYHPKFEKFLKGRSNELFIWPYNKKHRRRWYEMMQEGDSVLFWMGDGKYRNWGIIGFGSIVENKNPYATRNNEVILKTCYVPEKTIRPYANNFPRQTKNTQFLEDTFTLDFKPLKKTYKNLGKCDKIAIITVDSITKQQYNSCIDYAKTLNLHKQ